MIDGGIHLLPTCILLALTCGPSAAQGDEDAKKRFFSEAPAGWRRLRDAEQSVAGTLRLETTTNQGDTVVSSRDTTVEFTKLGDLVVLSARPSANTSGPVTTIGVNSRYAFKITRASAADPYLIRGLDHGPPEKTLDPVQGSSYFWRALQSPREIWNVPLEEVIADPGFVLKGISESSEGGQRVVRVDFDCDLEETTPKYRIVDARMVMSPDQDWGLRELVYTIRGDAEVRQAFDYRPSRAGPPTLRQVDISKQYLVDRSVLRYRWTFEKLDHREIAESELTLSAFGLPEPGQVGRSDYGGTLHYWLIGGAFAMLVAALGLRQMARRSEGLTQGA